MSKSPIILLDMDDVVAKHKEGLIAKYFEHTGIQLLRESFQEWHLENVLGKETTDYLFSLEREPGFFRDLEPVSGAIEAVEVLCRSGCDVVFVTASPPHGYNDKRLWIQEHMPFFPIENYVPTSRKDLVYGDVLCDDGPHNIIASMAGSKVVFDAPWNQCIDGFPRASGWAEALPMIFEIINRPKKGREGVA